MLYYCSTLLSLGFRFLTFVGANLIVSHYKICMRYLYYYMIIYVVANFKFVMCMLLSLLTFQFANMLSLAAYKNKFQRL